MEPLIQDLRYAFRELRLRPVFTAVAVVTLALGIGANSAVFSFANWVLLRPVPGVHEGRDLVVVRFSNEDGSKVGTSYPNLIELRERVGAIQTLAGYSEPIAVAVVRDGQPPRYVRAAFVSSQYFELLGAHARLGRSLNADDELMAPETTVAVLSHRLWSSLFGADSAAVGQQLAINASTASVIGVASTGFRGTDLLGDVDLWLPGSAYYTTLGFSRVALQDRSARPFDYLVGRLGLGANVQEATAQLEVAWSNLMLAYPEENRRWAAQPPVVFQGIGVTPESREDVSRAMTLLAFVAAVVLLIACANVANLLLFRGVRRKTQIAIRQALGASVGRMVRSHVTEILLLSVVAGLLAILLAAWLASLLRGPILPGVNDIEQVRLDWRVIGYTGMVALAAGLGCALAPVVTSLRGDVCAGLRHAATSPSRRTRRVRTVLATAQLSLSVSLLVVASLLVGSLRNLRNIDVGFDADRVTGFTVWPAHVGYSREESQSLLRRILATVGPIPGIEHVGLTAQTPFESSIGDRIKRATAAATDTGIAATAAWVSPGYFRTMGIPLIRGRTFDDGELFQPMMNPAGRVAVLSASLVQRLFGKENPVGEMITTQLPGPPFQIIGVARDSRWESLIHDGAGPILYQPIPNFAEGAVVLVRSEIPLRDLRPRISDAVQRLAPSVPVLDNVRLQEKIDRTISEERLLATLLTAFALLAVGLASIGLYAVISFSVAERTRELGIRIALGARTDQIVSLVLRWGGIMGAVGSVIGLVGAVALTRIVASRLYGISPVEPVVYVGVAALLYVLVLVSSLMPARRAARVDPIVALRAE